MGYSAALIGGAGVGCTPRSSDDVEFGSGDERDPSDSAQPLPDPQDLPLCDSAPGWLRDRPVPDPDRQGGAKPDGDDDSDDDDWPWHADREVPRNLRLDGETCRAMRLSWDPPSGDDYTAFRVYRNGTLVNEVPQTMAADLTWLERTGVYGYMVTAIRRDGSETPPSRPLVHIQLPCGAPSPKLRTATVLIRLPDAPDPRPVTHVEVNDLIYGGGASLRAHVEETSYGRQSISGQVRGWFTLPRTGSHYCEWAQQGQWFQCDHERLKQHVAQLLRDEIDAASLDRLILLYAGIGTVGVAAGSVTLPGGSIPAVELGLADGLGLAPLVHEFGHKLGSRHAGTVDCTASQIEDVDDPSASCRLSSYGDRYDPMGGSIGHYSMFRKEVFGYVDAERVRTIALDLPCQSTHVLDAAVWPSDGIQMLKLPLGDASYYFVEYRVPAGLDAEYVEDDTLVVRLKPGVPLASDTLLPSDGELHLGDQFHDARRRIGVEFLGWTRTDGVDRARVRVSRYP